jgi:hypothetical protein
LGSIVRNLFVMLIAVGLVACQPSERKRPIGLMRLGHVEDFLSEPVTQLPKFWLKIFRDERGLYAMSTLCSRELEPLLFYPDESMKCPRCETKFDPFGHASEGPAHELPYYKLGVGTGDSDTNDTLYVNIGEEVSKDWRLKIIEPDELEIEREDSATPTARTGELDE